MILYRKAPNLRLRRRVVPEPPLWAATVIAPYGGKRGSSLFVDPFELRASAVERGEATVAESVRDELERADAKQPLGGPVAIDAIDASERVYLRAEEALLFCCERDLAVAWVTSLRGALPAVWCEAPSKVPRRRAGGDASDDTVTLVAWPPAPDRIAPFVAALPPGVRWGLLIPVLYPVTTAGPVVEELVSAAAAAGASFAAAAAFETDAAARQALARMMGEALDDATMAALFDGSTDETVLATERNIAAVAAERGLADFVVPPRWDERSNWNGAVLLARSAARMMALELDVEEAARMAKSARVVAELTKPIARIAEAARVSIVEGIDAVSAQVLEQWLRGEEPEFVTRIDEDWRERQSL